VEAPNYRTLATSEPVVVPAVEAWRREVARREAGRKVRVTVTVVPVALCGVLVAAFGVSLGDPFAAGVGLVLAALGTLMSIHGFRQARWEREARIVLRWDRPGVTHSVADGGALAASWKEIVARAEALGVANPEGFLAVASETDRWFSVREGLDVFRALANGCLPGAQDQADLARLVDTLSTAPPPSPSRRKGKSNEPLRFRLEYVDASDGRSANELFASSYCVGQTRDLRA